MSVTLCSKHRASLCACKLKDLGRPSGAPRIINQYYVIALITARSASAWHAGSAIMATDVELEADLDKEQTLNSLKEFQENFRVRQKVFLGRDL